LFSIFSYHKVCAIAASQSHGSAPFLQSFKPNLLSEKINFLSAVFYLIYQGETLSQIYFSEANNVLFIAIVLAVM
jgi:hypothetical protein